MGLNASAYVGYNSENVNQTQISSVNQSCNQTFSARVEDIYITAIDSHIGDIELSSELNVGNLTCVLNSITKQAAVSVVLNKTDNEAQQSPSTPFQINLSAAVVINETDVQSFQQSIVNQTCNQSGTATIHDAVLTFIDSTTGNIKIASKMAIENFSCNLSAANYQTASSKVTDDTTNKVSQGCCGFGLGMCVPVILGLIAVGVVSKVLKGGFGRSSQGGQSQGLTEEDRTAALISQLSGQVNSMPLPGQAPVSALPRRVAAL